MKGGEDGVSIYDRLQSLFSNVEFDGERLRELTNLYQEANAASLELNRKYPGSTVKNRRRKKREALDLARRRFIDLMEYEAWFCDTEAERELEQALEQGWYKPDEL